MALQPAMIGCYTRADIGRNLDHIAELAQVAVVHAGIDLPVRLLAIPEGALQGFSDEVYDWNQQRYVDEIAIDLPGDETAALGALAREHNAYVVAQAKVRHPEFPGRYFNAAFILGPRGDLIHTYYKLQIFPHENSTAPHDIWDRWVELYGENLDAFFPVADTEIGRIGTIVCMDGSFPETARGLAVNGAEIIYRPSYPEPYVANGMWEIQNRARALDNTCYLVAPNVGSYLVGPRSAHPIDCFGGQSMIVDYRGHVASSHRSGGTASFSAAIVDIASLREYRERSLFGNWLKDLRTEQYRLIYNEAIYPRNRWLEQTDIRQGPLNEIRQQSVQRLVERGIWSTGARANDSC
ncbi:nitrilase-related carbon-nitrogen hydrolase [Mycobacteroides immunogenum]|uniref:nitrilase-related carbon-nitrogen hydrolase n=1 Tax=Mycobacteroides immunogenum TaxID=83262 RepID=UPI0025B748F6|nr:nitrilase-related carbon-nitrogen hydrolase [Mycobacteroides immunogenum]WJR36135.1 nitrilase-related carbon-nitrogen hydrolase [Mycobacteroides immunogenum]